MMKKKDKIFVAGHKGMVGSAILRLLKTENYQNIITVTREELDLRNEKDVEAFFELKKPDYVFLAAAKVGGIKANMTYPVEFLRDNLMIQNNIIHQCHRTKVKKIIFFGSACIYPKDCPQPMKEEYLLSGPLEPTNEGYALAKITGLKLVQYYHKEYGLKAICPNPCNLYGTNDSFDPDNSHVLSALVRKFVDAIDGKKSTVVVWGSGTARRDFMHVNDLARAVLFLIDKWDSPEIINVGPGEETSIKELVEIIAKKTGFCGNITWDTKMPDGMPRKCLDISKLRALGFKSSITLDEGISGVIEEYHSFKKRF